MGEELTIPDAPHEILISPTTDSVCVISLSVAAQREIGADIGVDRGLPFT
jgi:hypothetical protein